jgi:hypothetical protein
MIKYEVELKIDKKKSEIPELLHLIFAPLPRSSGPSTTTIMPVRYD